MAAAAGQMEHPQINNHTNMSKQQENAVFICTCGCGEIIGVESYKAFLDTWRRPPLCAAGRKNTNFQSSVWRLAAITQPMEPLPAPAPTPVKQPRLKKEFVTGPSSEPAPVEFEAAVPVKKTRSKKVAEVVIPPPVKKPRAAKAVPVVAKPSKAKVSDKSLDPDRKEIPDCPNYFVHREGVFTFGEDHVISLRQLTGRTHVLVDATRSNKTRTTISAASAVATAFMPGYSKGMRISYADNDPFNCAVDNLVIGKGE